MENARRTCLRSRRLTSTPPRRWGRAVLLSAFMLATVLFPAPPAFALDCTRTTYGLTPINDLGTGLYEGAQGGLYPGGTNVRPAEHDEAGLEIARQVAPRNAAGEPDPEGKYVLMSIGFSSPYQEFGALMPIVAADPDKDPQLVLVNGAHAAYDALDQMDPQSSYWSLVDAELAEAGVTPEQVAVVWLKESIGNGGQSYFPKYPEDLRTAITTITQIIKDRYPNVSLVYLSSRIYGGYNDWKRKREPYPYWTGFGAKWAIEEQIMGAPHLNYDPDRGPVEAPWMAWAPYFWADGLVPRSDGLTWPCEDFEDDGIHPSEIGEQKIAQMLLDFFRTDPTGQLWYLDPAVLPAVTISSGPSDPTRESSAVFDFTAEEEATFTCSLDGAPASACASGVSYDSLAEGPHTFSVWATDLDGNKGQPATWSWTVDSTPPELVGLEMADGDEDGRVDAVVASFSEPLAPSSDIAQWTLQSAPSGAVPASVAVSGSQAVLALQEGGGAPDTGVGAFTVALAVAEGGVRDAAGNSSSFPPTAPADRAAPVPVAVVDRNVGTQDRIEPGDSLRITFSEALAPTSVPAETTVILSDPGPLPAMDTLEVAGLLDGPLSTGDDRYVRKDYRSASFSASPVTLFLGNRGVGVTVGPACSGQGCVNLGRGGPGTFVLLPASTISDPAGNAAAGVFTQTGARLF